MAYSLEIWADSFHEGTWVATELGKRADKCTVSYHRGFIPVYTLWREGVSVELRVLGDYEAWLPRPEPVNRVLAFGKADFVLYAPDQERVLFVGEETAAVPTGNQSMQRCERMIGAAIQSPPVPFAYLLPEYGLHLDGQPRRTSPWPAMLAAKLSQQHKTTSLVLMYGDVDHLENYNVGLGVQLLFDLVATYVWEYIGLNKSLWSYQRDTTVATAHSGMLAFVKSQAPATLKVAPNYCTGGSSLEWPKASSLAAGPWFDAPSLRRPDPLLQQIYATVKKRLAYTLVPGSGSKPQSLKRLTTYISEHLSAVSRHNFMPDEYSGFNVDPSAFPQSIEGNYHVSSSQDITFLFDASHTLLDCFKKAFPMRAKAALRLEEELADGAAFLFTTASVKKGRIFGDPYVGQLSCFAKLLAYDEKNNKHRKVVGYFPLQSYGAFPRLGGNWLNSKGMRMYAELVDVIICHGGILAFPARRELV